MNLLFLILPSANFSARARFSVISLALAYPRENAMHFRCPENPKDFRDIHCNYFEAKISWQ